MSNFSYKQITAFTLLSLLTLFIKEIPAAASDEEYNYDHRKRDCEITLVVPGGEPLPQTLIAINQISNQFVFGGTIGNEIFDTLDDGYKNWFVSYFDCATPEKGIAWEQVMKCSEKCDPDYSEADSLIAWLLEKNIPIHGRSLFRNEKEDVLPEWTRDLETAAFKQAMLERIENTLGHFNGKISQWDLINEICHGVDGSLTSSGILETKSGDPDIFSWIMDEARKKDSVAEFIINDYDLVTSGDQTTAEEYVNKLKPLSSRFDIIGAEGHFNETMDKSTYEPNINYLAEQLGKPVWLTDVTFSFDIEQAPDKIEELMRTCFANPNVGGIYMGGWSRQFMQSNDLTSYFIDTTGLETPVGERWREVRTDLKTTGIAGYTDENGKFSFNGFQGKYVVVISCFTDTFYLEPGEGTQTIEVGYTTETGVISTVTGSKTTEININGTALPVKLPIRYNRQLFLTTYSLSGQQHSRSPVNQEGGKHVVTIDAPGCRIFRIETADRKPLYSGKIMAAR